MTIFFKSATHKQRFLGTINQIGKIENGKLDPEYAAALYILTASSGSWLKAAGHVSKSGIEFEELQATAYSSGEQFMVLVAWSLFNGHQSVNLADLTQFPYRPGRHAAAVEKLEPQRDRGERGMTP